MPIDSPDPRLPAKVGQWQTETFCWGEVSLELTWPADPDSLLDDPDVLAENELNDFMPYWGYLWPAARKMSERVFQADWSPGTRVLELGCGSGLIGLAALAGGCQVTFSDIAADALQLAAYNAEENGLTNYSVARLDWFAPDCTAKFPVVLAADVLYESRFHQPLLDLIPQLLEPEGVCWLGDPGRSVMLDFVHLASELGWDINIIDASGQPHGFPQLGQFQVLEMKPPTRSG